MRLYRALLYLYPASFRAEYGDEMAAFFRQQRAATSSAAVPALWVRTLVETFASATRVHGDALLQDLRFCARTFARSPGFAVTTVAIMALGIGATAATFSITDHVLIRPLPYVEPDRLVRLWESTPDYSQIEPSPPNYRDWKEASQTLEGMAAYTFGAANLVGTGEPRRLDVVLVTSGLLPTLGVPPSAGRLFTEEDDRKGAALTAVLSHSLWSSQFGSDPAVLGRTIFLDGEPHTVIGVMPAGFHFPSRDTMLWKPFQLGQSDYEDRDNNWLYVIARLKTDTTLEQARAEMAGIAARLEREYPEANTQTTASVNRVRDEVSRQVRLLLGALFGASTCLLLIACINVANLFLARALARRRELAVRSALGAGRERIIRQLLTEGLTLALLGGALGAAAAVAALPLLAWLVPGNLPIAQSPALDLRVLGFAAALTILTGVAFGLYPALRMSRDDDASGLRDTARAGGGSKERLRSALVIAEVGASVVLLVCAGLLLRALWRVQGVDPGFSAENVLTLRTALPFPKYIEVQARARFYDRVLTDVQALPGVTRAAYISAVPMLMRGGVWPVTIGGEAVEMASLRYVTPGFFAAMGIPMKQGRDVADSDAQNSLWVAVVSESLARHHWPGQNPIGKRFEFALGERTVVGVVGDVRVRGLESDSEPQVYIPCRQVLDGSILGYTPKDLVIRASVDPTSLVPAVRRIIGGADPEQPVSNVQTLETVLSDETAPRRMHLGVLVGFAAAAFLLAAIGIHGLLSYTVSQRTQEIGVRMALGARPGDILRLIARDGVVLALVGIAIGLTGAYAAGRAMESLLAGVQPGDALTYLSAAGLAGVMTIAGSLVPTLRAVRVDPTTAIRTD